MRTMSNGLVKITVVKHSETVQINVRRDTPDFNNMTFALSGEEMDEFINILMEVHNS